MIRISIEIDTGVYHGLKRDARAAGVKWQDHAASIIAAGVKPMSAEEISQKEDAARAGDIVTVTSADIAVVSAADLKENK